MHRASVKRDHPSLGFEEFNHQAQDVIERIAAQDPLAIIRYGSSLYQEDFLPGYSDLDLFVLSDRPLRFVDDRLGLNCSATHPNDFLKRLVTGNSFALCAILRGQAAYDPSHFIERVWSLRDCISLAPTPTTLQCSAESIGNQLSSAINRYFAEEESPAPAGPLLRNVSKVAENVAMAHIMLTAGKFLTGYTALRAALSEYSSDLILELDASRERFLRCQSVNMQRTGGPRISNGDELGAAILAAERLYVERASYARIKRRMRTNDLLEINQVRHGPIDRILAVRINEQSQTQAILCQRQDRFRLFGYRAGQGQPREIDVDVPPEDVEALRKQLLILR